MWILGHDFSGHYNQLALISVDIISGVLIFHGAQLTPNFFLVCGQRYTPPKNNRILNGQQTDINEYPWQAALIANGDNRPFCGGSLVNDRYVLTAAHCLEDVSKFPLTVILGEHNIVTSTESDEQTFSIELNDIKSHDNYNTPPMANDIAVIRLPQAVDFGLANHIRPICLPTVTVRVGGGLKVSGWGRTENGPGSRFLRHTTVIKVRHFLLILTIRDGQGSGTLGYIWKFLWWGCKNLFPVRGKFCW